MNLLQISDQIRNTSPVFIVGEARSGSTLLCRTLEFHSSFRPRKVRHIEAKVFDFTNLAHRIAPDADNSMYGYMLRDEENFAAFLQHIRVIRSLHRNTERKSARVLSLKHTVFWVLWLNHLVFRAYFYYAKESRGSQRTVEKTPDNTEHIGKIALAFPACKMLYTYRHPVDVFSSYRKIHKRSGANWARISPENLCSLYSRRVRIIREAQRDRPDSVMMIRYESFTRDPAGEFSRICDFLDESFEDAPISIRHNPDYNSRYEEYITESIRSKTKDWRDYVSMLDARKIENLLADTMRELGYERYTAGPVVRKGR